MIIKKFENFSNDSEDDVDLVRDYFIDLEDSLPVDVEVVKDPSGDAGYIVQIYRPIERHSKDYLPRSAFSEIFSTFNRIENMTDYVIGGIIIGNKRPLPFKGADDIGGNGRGVWTYKKNADFFKRYDPQTTVFSSRDTKMFSREDEDGSRSFDLLKNLVKGDKDQGDVHGFESVLDKLIFVEVYVRKPNMMWDNDINW